MPPFYCPAKMMKTRMEHAVNDDTRSFLPTTKEEVTRLGWDALDVVILSADAYVDHPAFAHALIGRYLTSLGLRVGIIPQPEWKSKDAFTTLGKPRMFFAVAPGNLDSMVALYTAQRKIRGEDAYSEGGEQGRRPYLPSVVYAQRAREAYKDVPIIVGGIEASLRRVTHYDFYKDTLAPSALITGKADMLVFGMGEAPLQEIVTRAKKGCAITGMRDIPGTAVPVGAKGKDTLPHHIRIPSHEEAIADKNAFLALTRTILEHADYRSGKALFHEVGSRGVFLNPPAPPISSDALDAVYALPFTRRAHPRYTKRVPALATVEHSITSHRGCYGGCSFCAITLHQGRTVTSRSEASVIAEVHRMTKARAKPIVITDVGGPSANMYGTRCARGGDVVCTRRSCLVPAICPHLSRSQDAYRALLRAVHAHAKVKRVYVNSGFRYDLLLDDVPFIQEIVTRYTQGHLSVAPEHADADVLALMGKPPFAQYEAFARIFARVAKEEGVDYYLVPYLMVGHPGADEKAEAYLVRVLQKMGVRVEQVQEFLPTPMTLSTAMYYAHRDPLTGEDVAVERKGSVKKRWKARLIGHF